MTVIATLSGREQALGLFGLVVIVLLAGIWLLASGAARRSALIDHGGSDLRRRRGPIQLLDDRLSRTERGRLLTGRLRSAGTELTAARFLLLVAGLALGALLIAHLLFPLPLAVAAMGAAVWGAFAWLDRRLQKRKEELVSQLPEIARLMSNASSAGLSMPAAIELTAREIESPAREELQTVVDELTLGRPLEDSLAALRARLPSREISVLMTTLVIQQRAGGDVVRALHTLSDTLDGRRETLREIRTLMTGAVVTSYIVPLLGLGALLLLNTISSNTLTRLTSNPVGIVILVTSAVLYALGSALIRRIARVDL